MQGDFHIELVLFADLVTFMTIWIDSWTVLLVTKLTIAVNKTTHFCPHKLRKASRYNIEALKNEKGTFKI